MSRNYMRVVVANESNATLRLKGYSTSGEWTPGGWAPSSIPVTPPGAGLHWQAEGEAVVGVPLSGVEARAWYEVVDSAGAVVGELYIFANCPWIESQYGNRFHIHAPKGFYASYIDANGQKRGNRSILDVRFRNTEYVAVPGFRPSANGFQFSNSWSEQLPVISIGTLWNQLRSEFGGDLAAVLGIPSIAEDFIPITHADSGLCGGMVYSTMDYFYARQLPPTAAFDAALNRFVPPSAESDLLFRHVRQRLLDSFDFTGRGHRWLSYTSPIYPDDDEGPLQTAGVVKGKSFVTYREEWPQIRDLLDRGLLAPIGLVQSAQFDIGANHQVLAYAYRQDGQSVQLWVYDPNIPEQSRNYPDAESRSPVGSDDVYLEFDITNTTNGITVIRRNYRPKDYQKRIYAILHMDNYQARVAPFGRQLPPPSAPRNVRFEVDSESMTVDGTITREETGHCGNKMRWGHWILKTTSTYVAQVYGFLDPQLRWTVGGVDVAMGATTTTVNSEGNAFQVDCQLYGNAYAL